MDRYGRLGALKQMSGYLTGRSESSLCSQLNFAVELLATRDQHEKSEGASLAPSKDLDTSLEERDVLLFLRTVAEQRDIPHVRAALDCLVADCEVEIAVHSNKRVARPTTYSR